MKQSLPTSQSFPVSPQYVIALPSASLAPNCDGWASMKYVVPLMAEDGRAVSLRPRFPNLSTPQPGRSARASRKESCFEALISSPRDLDGPLRTPHVPDHVVVAAVRVTEEVLVEVLHRVSREHPAEGVGEPCARGVPLSPCREVARGIRAVPSVLRPVAVLVAGEDLELVGRLHRDLSEEQPGPADVVVLRVADVPVVPVVDVLDLEVEEGTPAHR